MEKKKISIVVDSGCDFPKGYAEEKGIAIIYIPAILGDREYFNVSNKVVLDYVKTTGKLPKTAAPSIEDYSLFFNKQLQKAENLIYFGISTGVSLSCTNAQKAAENFENVHIIDTKQLSSGIALLVMKAQQQIENGIALNEILNSINNNLNKVSTSFVLDKLTLLYKGGRCSKLALLGANLLMIKPSIVMKEGALGVGKKYRKKIEVAFEHYIEDILNDGQEKDLESCFITYTTFNEASVKWAIEKLKKAGFKTVHTSIASATIASHCGENTIGLLYLKKD